MGSSFYPGAMPLADNLHFKNRMQLLVGPYNEDYVENAGNFQNGDLAWDIQESEVWGADSTVQVLRVSEVYRVGATLTFPMLQLTPWLKSILWSAYEDSVVDLPAIVAAATKTITGAKKGRIYSTGRTNIVVTGVVDGDDVALVAGVDYRVDAKTGRIEALLDHDEMVVSYTSPAHKKQKYSLGAAPSKYYRVICRQVNAQGDDIHFTKCLIRVEGNVTLGGDGAEFSNVSITIKVMIDPLAEEGFELGFAVPLQDEAA